MAETKAPRRLDEALRPGGLYYLPDGTAHDANGNVLENAPKRPENTAPDEQPFARLQASGVAAGGFGGFDVKALGLAIGMGLQAASEGKLEDPNKDAPDTNAQRDELHAALSEDVKPKQGAQPIDARPPAPGVLPADPANASKPSLGEDNEAAATGPDADNK